MVEPHERADDGSSMPTIGDLIRIELDAGKTFRELAAASGFRVKHQTFQELSKQPPKQFPKASKTIIGMSVALSCTETVVVLAYARGLGINVVRQGAEFALRLPSRVDDLAPDMKNALLSVMRAAVNQNEMRRGSSDKPKPDADERFSGWRGGADPGEVEGGDHRAE